MKRDLTKRQKDLLKIIYRYIKNSGYPPSFEEMRGELNVASNQSVIDLLNKLSEKKFVKKEEGTARAIKLLPSSFKILGQPSLAPFAGVTSAGYPLEAIETLGEWQELPGGMARLKDDVFLLKVRGDSMINAGINDGDTVLVKSDKEFVSGNIVLARVGNETTIKRFISEDKPPYVWLQPENPKYPIMPFTDETELKGKVISVFKNSY